MARRTHGTRPQQQGLALITAVLVVAIVATVATTLALGEQVWLRQAQNVNDRAQAESLRQGALGYAAILLTRDGNQNKQTDYLGSLWAQPLPPLPVENGMIVFAVSDAQARFNLNNLVKSGARSQADVTIFNNLLTAQHLDPSLTNELLNWMSPASTNSAIETVDTEYLNLPQPYRAANQLLTSVDELRLVKGFTAAAVDLLRPYVTVLPVYTAVNLNTAKAEVLAALFPSPPATTVLQPLLDSRVTKPFTNVADFQGQLPTGLTLISNGPYDVKTSYFLVTIDIRYGRLQRRTEALIERTRAKPATVLWHQLPPLQLNKMSADEKT
jgi:general secretion pathway protein K